MVGIAWDSSRNRDTTRNISTSKNELEIQTDRVLLWMIDEFRERNEQERRASGWMDRWNDQTGGKKAFDIVHKGITSWGAGAGGSINKNVGMRAATAKRWDRHRWHVGREQNERLTGSNDDVRRETHTHPSLGGNKRHHDRWFANKVLRGWCLGSAETGVGGSSRSLSRSLSKDAGATVDVSGDPAADSIGDTCSLRYPAPSCAGTGNDEPPPAAPPLPPPEAPLAEGGYA